MRHLPRISFVRGQCGAPSAGPQGSERAAADLADREHRKNNLRYVSGEVIMCLNDCRSKGIWQAAVKACRF